VLYFADKVFSAVFMKFLIIRAESGGSMKKRRPVILLQIVCISILVSLSACAGWDPDKEQREADQVRMTIERFMERDPGLQTFFDKAYGYAVFPRVGKGAYIIGGTYGRGLVYEQGNHIGKTSIIAASVGLQIGGQEFSEIIFFRDKVTMDFFKQGNLELSAQASAVAVTTGIAAKTQYDEGIAVFVLPTAGLMFEASVGGQKFTFEPR
jgi:lipid-binding SYLF domain-containing protein